MEKIIFDSIQEIFLFDLFEMIILLYLYIIETKVKIKKIQFIYSLGILTLMDLIISALNFPIIMQIIFIFIVVLYLKKLFQLTVKQNIIAILKFFLAGIIIEIPYIYLFSLIFGVQLISMPLNIIRFYYLIPLRIIEFIILYLYYKWRIK